MSDRPCSSWTPKKTRAAPRTVAAPRHQQGRDRAAARHDAERCRRQGASPGPGVRLPGTPDQPRPPVRVGPAPASAIAASARGADSAAAAVGTGGAAMTARACASCAATGMDATFPTARKPRRRPDLCDACAAAAARERPAHRTPPIKRASARSAYRRRLKSAQLDLVDLLVPPP